jgi:hypothetical protein
VRGDRFEMEHAIQSSIRIRNLKIVGLKMVNIQGSDGWIKV